MRCVKMPRQGLNSVRGGREEMAVCGRGGGETGNIYVTKIVTKKAKPRTVASAIKKDKIRQ